MSTTRPRKDSTILAPIDIGDQPVGRLIFLTEGAAGTQAFSVDLIELEGEIVYGKRFNPGWARTGGSLESIIIAVPVRSPWTVVARNAVTFRTLEESMQKQKTDREQEAELMKTVFGVQPEAASPPAKLPLLSLVCPTTPHI